MLPEPSSERFQPLRSGLINLYKYEDQEFWFERGRLLLRGNNGSGKSRVLALQLPFLFDGEISPHRIEPDGDPAKSVAWNLLMNEYDDRIGYTWIEFGRQPQGAPPVFVTLGCGMRAIKGVDGPNRWFFVTDKRLGEHFSLLTDRRQPLSRDQLTLVLGESALYRTAQAYRHEVDARLFGLKMRYDSLVELLIRLRAPQLQRKLDEERLSGALSDALPPLSDGLITDLANSFRNLDSLRHDLENHRQIQHDVSEFLKDYCRYLQTAARRRAEAVRSHHSRYEETNRDILENTRQLEAAKEDIGEAEQAKRDAGLEAAAASAELEALRQSPFQQDVIALNTARREAQGCETTYQNAKENTLSSRSRSKDALQDRDRREWRLNELNSNLSEILKHLSGAAETASFLAEHEEQLPPIARWPDKPNWLSDAEKNVSQRVKRRSESISYLVQLQNFCLEALRHLSEAQKQETVAEQRVNNERESERLHDEHIQSLSESLVVDYTEWSSSLAWLHPPTPSDLIDTLLRWIETDLVVDRILPTVLEEAVANAEGERRRELADVDHALQGVENCISQLVNETKDLESGHHTPPAASVTRDPDARNHINGAPLWQVCDFQIGLRDDEQAGLEAALEAAGLLDALITPVGTLIPRDACDTFLTDTGATQKQTNLNLWLRPVDHEFSATLNPTAVQTALAVVGAASGQGEHWVDTDGHWQLGPISGRGRKPAAAHIGEGARERSRQQRLREINLELSSLASDKQLHEDKIRELMFIRTEAIRRERAGAPSDDPIAASLALRAAARERLIRFRKEYDVAQENTAKFRQLHQAAAQDRERAATDLGLGQWQERPDDLKERWETYLRFLERMWPTARHWDDARQQLEQATNTVSRSHEEVQQAEASEREAESRAVEARSRYETLNANVGASVAKLESEINAAGEKLDHSRRAQNAAEERLSAAKVTAGITQQKLQDLDKKLDESVRDRAAAIEKLGLLAQHGLFSDAHASFSTFESEPWSVTRAVEISRDIERKLRDVPSDDSAWRNRQSSVLQLFNELQTSLGAHGHQPQIESADEGLLAIACPFHGRPLRLGQLHDAVRAEIETQERLLTEREREIIDNHLIGEVATSLQDLIRDAEAKVAEMNAEIETCSTSTGLTMRLRWEPRTEEIPDGLPEVRRLLLADSELWVPEERTQIGQFLHRLIQDARQENPAGTWSDHLRQALDYRSWHRFYIERRQNDRWERLTKRRYGTGSGGEKALMLTVPQMAAAAAHYRSAAPYAPRLILLDEVFVGIDSKVRAKCMGLLEAFDLDFVMTSEREWGAYSTIRGLAIYQLTTSPGIEAIATTRWIWNGRQRLLAPTMPILRTSADGASGLNGH